MLDSIKSELHLRLNELFAEAAVDKLAGDAEGYKAKLLKIAQVSDVLGVATKITYVNINLTDDMEEASRLS